MSVKSVQRLTRMQRGLSVALRIRPALAERNENSEALCFLPRGYNRIGILPYSSEGVASQEDVVEVDHLFGPSSTQDELYSAFFERSTEACLQGFSSAGIVLGDEGSGKSYTVLAIPSHGNRVTSSEAGALFRILGDIFHYKRKNAKTIRVDVEICFVCTDLSSSYDMLRGVSTIATSLPAFIESGSADMVVDSLQTGVDILLKGVSLREQRGLSVNSVSLYRVKVTQRAIAGGVVDEKQQPICTGEVLLADLPLVTPGTHATLDVSRAHRHVMFAKCAKRLHEMIRNIKKGSSYSVGNEFELLRLFSKYTESNAVFLMLGCLAPTHTSYFSSLNTLRFCRRLLLLDSEDAGTILGSLDNAKLKDLELEKRVQEKEIEELLSEVRVAMEGYGYTRQLHGVSAHDPSFSRKVLAAIEKAREMRSQEDHRLRRAATEEVKSFSMDSMVQVSRAADIKVGEIKTALLNKETESDVLRDQLNEASRDGKRWEAMAASLKSDLDAAGRVAHELRNDIDRVKKALALEKEAHVEDVKLLNARMHEEQVRGQRHAEEEARKARLVVEEAAAGDIKGLLAALEKSKKELQKMKQQRDSIALRFTRITGENPLAGVVENLGGETLDAA